MAGKVLVLGEETRIVLPVVRSLGRRGRCVHVGWLPHKSPVAGSRYVHRIHKLPPYEPQGVWKARLQELICRERFDLVLPVTESAVVAVQRDRSGLDDAAPIYVISDLAFETCFDKAKTYALAERLAIPYPRTRVLNECELRDGDLPLPFPLVIKPVRSVSAADVQKKNFAHVMYDRSALERFLLGLPSLPPELLVQEFIRGEGAGVEVLAHEGEVLFAFQHLRLHETNGFGSTYRKSTPLSPELVDATAKLIRALNYTGVAMVEFRVDSNTRRWSLLEVNARFWGSLALAVAAGADFPAYLYEMLVQGRRKFPQEYRTGVRCRNLRDDLRWLWRTFRPGRIERGADDHASMGWAVNPTSRRQAARDTLRGLLLLDYADEFARDDPLPAVYGLLDVPRIILGKAFPRRSLQKSNSPQAAASRMPT